MPVLMVAVLLEHPIAKFMDGQLRRIQNPVGTNTQFTKALPFELDPFKHGLPGEEWMRAAGLGKSTSQDHVIGFQVQEFHDGNVRLKPFKIFGKIRKEFAFANINAQGDLSNRVTALAAEFRK